MPSYIEEAYAHLTDAVMIIREARKANKSDPTDGPQFGEADQQAMNHALDLADRAKKVFEQDLSDDFRIELPEPEAQQAAT